MGEFYGCAHLEDGGFVEVFAHDLDADRKAISGGAAGDADAADSGERGGDGVDIREVHGHGIVGFFTDFEGWRGSHGADDDIHLGKGFKEVAGDEGANLLRLLVVGVVVAGRQDVRAEEDAALNLGPEGFVAGLLVHG